MTRTEDGGFTARFELICATSKDAHDWGRRLLAHRLSNKNGIVFELIPKRTLTPEEDSRVREKDSQSEEESELQSEDISGSESGVPTGKGSSSGAGTENGGDRKLRGHGQSRRMKFTSIASSLQSEDVEDLTCEQCHRMYDRDNPNANGERWPNGVDRLPGLTVSTRPGRFCSLTCRSDCMKGKNPLPWCAELRKSKERRNDLDEQMLLLLQAHETQRLREKGELEACEAEVKARRERNGQVYIPPPEPGLTGKELERRREEKYGGESKEGIVSPEKLDRYRLIGLTKLSRANVEVRNLALKEWYIKRLSGELKPDEVTAFVKEQARNLRNVINEEVRTQIEEVDKNDPDYKRIVFRIRSEYVLRSRRDHDVASGTSRTVADKRHKDRLRVVCSWAEKDGTIEKRTAIGAERTEPTPRAKTERKKRCKKDGNKWAKELSDKLKVVAHLSYWT